MSSTLNIKCRKNKRKNHKPNVYSGDMTSQHKICEFKWFRFKQSGLLFRFQNEAACIFVMQKTGNKLYWFKL